MGRLRFPSPGTPTLRVGSSCLQPWILQCPAALKSRKGRCRTKVIPEARQQMPRLCNDGIPEENCKGSSSFKGPGKVRVGCTIFWECHFRDAVKQNCWSLLSAWRHSGTPSWLGAWRIWGRCEAEALLCPFTCFLALFPLEKLESELVWHSKYLLGKPDCCLENGRRKDIFQGSDFHILSGVVNTA